MLRKQDPLTIKTDTEKKYYPTDKMSTSGGSEMFRSSASSRNQSGNSDNSLRSLAREKEMLRTNFSTPKHVPFDPKRNKLSPKISPGSNAPSLSKSGVNSGVGGSSGISSGTATSSAAGNSESANSGPGVVKSNLKYSGQEFQPSKKKEIPEFNPRGVAQEPPNSFVNIHGTTEYVPNHPPGHHTNSNNHGFRPYEQVPYSSSRYPKEDYRSGQERSYNIYAKDPGHYGPGPAGAGSNYPTTPHDKYKYEDPRSAYGGSTARSHNDHSGSTTGTLDPISPMHNPHNHGHHGNYSHDPYSEQYGSPYGNHNPHARESMAYGAEEADYYSNYGYPPSESVPPGPGGHAEYGHGHGHAPHGHGAAGMKHPYGDPSGPEGHPAHKSNYYRRSNDSNYPAHAYNTGGHYPASNEYGYPENSYMKKTYETAGYEPTW